jgi:drug/metabolite transporter (DMT)-like permease
MSWFYLALLAPLIYAVVNLIDDNLMRHIYRSPHSGAIISGLFGGLPLLSLAFHDYTNIPLQFELQAVLAGFLLVAFYYCYFLSLDRESPSVVVALTNMAPLLIGILAFIFLGERLGDRDVVSLALILAASIGLSLSSGPDRTHFKRSIGPIIFAGIFISVNSLLIKDVFDHVPFYSGYMWLSAGMVTGGFYFLLVLYHADQREILRDLRRIVRKYFGLFVFAEGMALLAEFTMNLAISRGPVTIIRTIEGIQPLFVLLIALVFYPLRPQLFREANEGKVLKKFFYIAVIIVGLFLLSRTLS